MRTFSVLLSLALGLSWSLLGCAGRRVPPHEARVFTEDVPRFYAAVDGLAADASVDAVRERLEAAYFAGGSPGLAAFQRARIGSAEQLASTFLRRRAYYTSIRADLLALAADPTVEPRARAAFVRIAEWSPGVRFPDTWLTVGRMNSAGTVAGPGLLLGLEMFGRSDRADLTTLDTWALASIRSRDDVVQTIVHESIHGLQRLRNPSTLLGAAVQEGMCDFIACLALGVVPDSPTYVYAFAHEAELWDEFRGVMDAEDFGDWLWGPTERENRPPDLGYAVGYLICAALHARLGDDGETVRMLLETRDPEGVLRRSGYDGTPRSRQR